MRRLVDAPDSLERGEQLLAVLFEAAPQPEVDPFRKRRIRGQLENRGRSARFGLRTAIVGGTLLVATAAAATVGPGPIRAAWRELFPAATPAQTMIDPKPLERAAEARFASTQVVKPAEAGAAAPGTSGVRPSAGRVTAPPGEDPTLVVSAIRSLRNQHDPAKARVLLGQYLKTNPRGALAEEALALSIEAAAAMKDKQAVDLARRYLAAYPNGRHRQLALQVSEK